MRSSVSNTKHRGSSKFRKPLEPSVKGRGPPAGTCSGHQVSGEGNIPKYLILFMRMRLTANQKTWVLGPVPPRAAVRPWVYLPAGSQSASPQSKGAGSDDLLGPFPGASLAHHVNSSCLLKTDTCSGLTSPSEGDEAGGDQKASTGVPKPLPAQQGQNKLCR